MSPGAAAGTLIVADTVMIFICKIPPNGLSAVVTNAVSVFVSEAFSLTLAPVVANTVIVQIHKTTAAIGIHGKYLGGADAQNQENSGQNHSKLFQIDHLVVF